MPKLRHLIVLTLITALAGALPVSVIASEKEHQVRRQPTLSASSWLVETVAGLFAKIGMEVLPSGDALPDDDDDQARNDQDSGAPPQQAGMVVSPDS